MLPAAGACCDHARARVGVRVRRRASHRSPHGAGHDGLAAAGAFAWIAANGIERLAGGLRRFTGSRWLPDGGIPPATTFFGERVQPMDAGGWRLTVSGRVARPERLSLAALTSTKVERDAVLDCTSGWALHGLAWRAAGRGADAGGPTRAASTVIVRSASGWYASLPLDEARRGLLATGVAGRPLPHANGAPCRLVAPNRRGLEWVKWVTEVEVA